MKHTILLSLTLLLLTGCLEHKSETKTETYGPASPAPKPNPPKPNPPPKPNVKLSDLRGAQLCAIHSIQGMKEGTWGISRLQVLPATIGYTHEAIELRGEFVLNERNEGNGPLMAYKDGTLDDEFVLSTGRTLMSARSIEIEAFDAQSSGWGRRFLVPENMRPVETPAYQVLITHHASYVGEREYLAYPCSVFPHVVMRTMGTSSEETLSLRRGMLAKKRNFQPLILPASFSWKISGGVVPMSDRPHIKWCRAAARNGSAATTEVEVLKLAGEAVAMSSIHTRNGAQPAVQRNLSEIPRFWRNADGILLLTIAHQSNPRHLNLAEVFIECLAYSQVSGAIEIDGVVID